MEKLQQMRADINALLKIDNFAINHCEYLELTNRYSIAVETKIGDKVRILHAAEHSIMDSVTAIQNQYDILCRAGYETKTFKLAENGKEL